MREDTELAAKLRALSQSYSERGPAPVRKREIVYMLIFLTLCWMYISKDDYRDQLVIEEKKLKACEELAQAHADVLDYVLAGGSLTYGQKLVNCKVKS